MLQKTSMMLLTVLLSWTAWADSQVLNPIDVMGLVHYPVYRIGGETTGMDLSVANHKPYELEMGDAEMLRWAQELNGTLVKISGDVYIKEGVEVEKREIIRVNKLEVVPLKMKCEGSQFQAGFYEEGKIATVQQLENLMGLLDCNKVLDEVNQQEMLSCRESNRVDAGYELVPMGLKLYKLYELSFAGKRQVDVLTCR